MMNNRVFYRCTVDDCPLRYVQEVYCVSCAQTNKDGHCHDHVYMDDSDPYLVKYRQDVEAMRNRGHPVTRMMKMIPSLSEEIVPTWPRFSMRFWRQGNNIN
jgi:hypothetical protein